MRDYKNENVMSLTKDLLHVVTIVLARMINSGCMLISTFKCTGYNDFTYLRARGVINFNKTFYGITSISYYYSLAARSYFGASVFFLFFIISHERYSHGTIVFVKFDFDSACMSSFSIYLSTPICLSIYLSLILSTHPPADISAFAEYICIHVCV
jgi:hypothetical protein